MEKISVIIPTYNRADKIEKSIRSVLNQTYSDMQVLVIDDASTDNTCDVVNGIEDERIRYIHMEENKGASVARNAGVSCADTEWIAFHDSDDEWRVDKLEKQMQYKQKHPECGLIYSAYAMHFSDGKELIVPNASMVGALEGDIVETLLQNNTIGAPTILMKKSVFEENKGFDTSFNCLEDWDFVLRVSYRHPIGYVNEVLVDAYQSAGGVSSNISAYYSCRCKMIAQNKDELVQRGLFDIVVMSLLEKASTIGILEIVQKMLMQSFMQYQ